MERSVLDPTLAERLKDVYHLVRPPATVTEFADLLRARRQERLQMREFTERVRSGRAVIGECGEEHGYSVLNPDGRETKVMCAYDALMTSVLRSQGLVKAACPHCGKRMEILIEEKTVVGSSSPSIMFWWGTGPKGEAGNPVCDHLHLFPDREHLSAWLRTRPDELGISSPLKGTLEFLAQLY